MHEIARTKKSGVLIWCAIGFEMQTLGDDAKAAENLESGSTNRFLLASMSSSPIRKVFATFLKRKAARIARMLYTQCIETIQKSLIYTFMPQTLPN